MSGTNASKQPPKGPRALLTSTKNTPTPPSGPRAQQPHAKPKDVPYGHGFSLKGSGAPKAPKSMLLTGAKNVLNKAVPLANLVATTSPDASRATSNAISNGVIKNTPSVIPVEPSPEEIK